MVTLFCLMCWNRVAVAVSAESVAAEAFVQHRLHAAFALDAFGGVIREVLVETNARVRVPPQRM